MTGRSDQRSLISRRSVSRSISGPAGVQASEFERSRFVPRFWPSAGSEPSAGVRQYGGHGSAFRVWVSVCQWFLVMVMVVLRLCPIWPTVFATCENSTDPTTLAKPLELSKFIFTVVGPE